MEYIDWKESDINKINMDKKWLISEYLCICFEELASYLFLYQTEVCIEEKIVKKIIQVSEDVFDQNSSQAINKYISFKKTKDTGSSITFSRVEYQMYFLSSWITRNLCKIACNECEHSFDNFFVKNFSKVTLLQKNLEILQKFSKQMKDYNIEIYQFKSIIFEYLNRQIENKFYYCSDGKEFDLSKKILFINSWGIIKSYFYCQSPISSLNKNIFTKLMRVFFKKEDKLEHLLSGMNFAYMDLSETDLSETIFVSVDFTHTNFYNANLDDVTFDKVKLENANFESAFMEVSGIYDSDCSGASFKGTHLLATVIENSNLRGVNFRGTNLMECDIINSCFTNVEFDDNTALNSTSFINSGLSEIDLTGINLAGISISSEQIKYFWECTKGIKDVKIYGNEFRKLEELEEQEELYKSLVESIDDYIATNKFPQKSQDVFISHSTLEKNEIARPICDFLERNGYSTWIDDEKIEPDKLRFSIETGLNNCNTAIIIISDKYITRGWTRYELLRIIQESKKRKINVIVIAFHLADIENCPKEFKKIIIQDVVEEEFWGKLLELLEG